MRFRQDLDPDAASLATAPARVANSRGVSVFPEFVRRARAAFLHSRGHPRAIAPSTRGHLSTRISFRRRA